MGLLFQKDDNQRGERQMITNQLNKNRIILLWLAIAFFLLVNSPTVVANQTDASAGFQLSDDSTEPVDPEKPEKPIKPVHPPTKGPLSLNYVSDIQFGTHKRSNSTQVFYAQLDKIDYLDASETQKRANFVELTDNRGSNAGWHLTVKQNGQLQNQAGEQLEGAIISFKQITPRSLDGVGKQPTAIPTEPVSLSPNGITNSLILTAQKGTGMGSWSISFGKDEKEGIESILVTIPEKTPKKDGAYSTTLTWTLGDSL